MNKYAIITGMTLMGFSFYSIGPVIRNELNPGCIGIEHYYTVLPYFLGMLLFGLIFLTMGFKSISMQSFSKAE